MVALDFEGFKAAQCKVKNCELADMPCVSVRGHIEYGLAASHAAGNSESLLPWGASAG